MDLSPTDATPDPDRPTERRASLVDDAYAALKVAIREAVYAPGQHLSAQEIATGLGMSRTPIHEASLRLQEEGLLRIVPKRGIEIRAIRPADMAEIYEVVIAIEAAAAERAAGLAGDLRTVAADRLDRTITDMAIALAHRDQTRWGASDEQFHEILVEAAGNERFVRIIRTVKDQWHRARMVTLGLRDGLDASLAEHRAIAEAIRAGDAAAAFAAARAHRTRVRDELLPLIERIGLRHF